LGDIKSGMQRRGTRHELQTNPRESGPGAKRPKEEVTSLTGFCRKNGGVSQKRKGDPERKKKGKGGLFGTLNWRRTRSALQGQSRKPGKRGGKKIRRGGAQKSTVHENQGFPLAQDGFTAKGKSEKKDNDAVIIKKQQETSISVDEAGSTEKASGGRKQEKWGRERKKQKLDMGPGFPQNFSLETGTRRDQKRKKIKKTNKKGK